MACNLEMADIHDGSMERILVSSQVAWAGAISDKCYKLILFCLLKYSECEDDKSSDEEPEMCKPVVTNVQTSCLHGKMAQF